MTGAVVMNHPHLPYPHFCSEGREKIKKPSGKPFSFSPTVTSLDVHGEPLPVLSTVFIPLLLYTQTPLTGSLVACVVGFVLLGLVVSLYTQ
jgi:hypothetical protein